MNRTPTPATPAAVACKRPSKWRFSRMIVPSSATLAIFPYGNSMVIYQPPGHSFPERENITWVGRQQGSRFPIGYGDRRRRDPLEEGGGFLTLVYQIDDNRKRLLWVGQNRSEATIRAFFTWFGKERAASLEYVCSDMWKPYLKIIAQKASSAINVLDRFHIMSHFSSMLRNHRELLLNWFEAKGKISAGVVEGMHNKAKTTTKKA